MKRYLPYLFVLIPLILGIALITRPLTMGAISPDYRASFVDQDDKPFILGSDPYYYYRLTDDIIQHGYPGDTIKEGIPVDTHLVQGRSLNEVSGIVYIQATFHRLHSSLNPNATVRDSVFLMPVFTIVFTIILFYFLALRFTNTFGALASSILFISLAIATRKLNAGFADTDQFNILFPTLLVFFIVLANQAKNYTRYIYACLAGIFIGIYSWVWTGWFFIFDVIILALVIHTICLIIYKEKIEPIYTHGTFIISSFISLAIIKSPNAFLNGLLGPFNQGYVPIIKGWLIYPTILIGIAAITWTIYIIRHHKKYIKRHTMSISVIAYSLLILSMYILSLIATHRRVTVSELNSITLSTAITSLGGIITFLFALAGLIYLIFNSKDTLSMILLFLWSVLSIYAFINAVRFNVIAILPISLLFGYFSIAIYHESYRVTKNTNLRLISTAVIVFIILFIPFVSAVSKSWGTIPLLRKPVYNTIQNMEDNGIAIAWWDKGYIIQAVSDLPTVWDGGSHSLHLRHWVSIAYNTQDPELSRSIITMLVCSQDQAYDHLKKQGLSTAQAEQAVFKALRYHNSTFLEKYLMCDSPTIYLLLTNDDVQKAAGWLGSNNAGFDETIGNCTIRQDQYQCSNGAIYNAGKPSIMVNNIRTAPSTVVYINNNTYTATTLNPKSPYDVMFYENKARLTTKGVAATTFARLYFYPDHPPKGFTLIHKEDNKYGDAAVLYTVRPITE